MEDKRRILIVDDESGAREGLRELVAGWDFIAEQAGDGTEALQLLETFRPHLVITDLVMPGMSGLELLRQVRCKSDRTAVVILTAQGSIHSAVDSIKEGAYDYITKPVDIVRLKHTLDHLFEKLDFEKEIQLLKKKLTQLGNFDDLIGNSPQMKEVFHQIELAAPSTASVLITGPSGTGKELVARAIHQRSARRNKPFVIINCSAIPETLLESEIFGHERGAFTGAERMKEGCYELAHGGTLFLDEIAEMAPDLQAKLLRVLESGTFRRVGGKVELKADVRLLAASNMRIGEAIKQGKFREDLFYRLNVFHLELPSLKERVEDIPLLLQHFLENFNKKNAKSVQGVDLETVNLLKSHSWPGNVRELKNVVERAVIVCRGQIITPSDLPAYLRPRSTAHPTVTFPIGSSIDQVEKEMLVRTLTYTGGNKTKAAKLLGISLKTLHNKVHRFQLNR